MLEVRWATLSQAGRARGAGTAVMVAGAVFLAGGCGGHSDAGAAATRGSGETVAPTAVVTSATQSPTTGTPPAAPAPTKRPPGATTVPATTAGREPPVGSDPALPAGVYLGRFSAIDTAHQRARLTIEDSYPECSGARSGTYVVDLTNTRFTGTSGTGKGEALDLTFDDWAKNWAARDHWTVDNRPGHGGVTNGPNAGCDG